MPVPVREPDPDDNLAMITDMFETIRRDGLDPGTPVKEIADIALQVIEMVRRRDIAIRELREMHNRLVSVPSHQHSMPYNGPWSALQAVGVAMPDNAMGNPYSGEIYNGGKGS
jgi:hypothetical protein